jgi:CHAT domain-containing protein
VCYGSYPSSRIASSDNFKRLSKSSHIFHLCAHGTFEPESPHLSQIELFQDSLRVIDFCNFQLQAALVVFSSCLSGLSRGLDSASALGFAHTILGTGAQAFVGTLWPVHEVATLLFMVSFYRSVRAGKPPAESLMIAQNTLRCMDTEAFHDPKSELDYLLDGGAETYEKYVYVLKWRLNTEIWTIEIEKFRHPRLWAGFVLIGYGDEPIYARQPKRRRTDESGQPSKRPLLVRGHTST